MIEAVVDVSAGKPALPIARTDSKDEQVTWDCSMSLLGKPKGALKNQSWTRPPPASAPAPKCRRAEHPASLQ